MRGFSRLRKLVTPARKRLSRKASRSAASSATAAPSRRPPTFWATPPPAGSPNFLLNFGTNSLNLWKFHVDWTNSANTTLTGPTRISVATFTPACNGGACIPQPGTTQLLNSVHRAGVAQGDLHHRDILVGPGGNPYLVDFSTAVILEQASGRFKYRLFRAACGSDRRAALKLTLRHAPRCLTAEERHELSHPPLWYRFGKRLRRSLNAIRTR